MSKEVKAALITTAGVIIVGLIALLPTYWGPKEPPPPAARTIAGVVADCRGPLKDAAANVRSAQGNKLAGGPTDSNGDFLLTFTVPASGSTLVLEISKDGYESKTFNVPATSDRQKFELKQLPLTFGISEGTFLEPALSHVASRLNVTVRFAESCKPPARKAALGAVTDLPADALCQPQAALQELVDRVKQGRVRYEVKELQARRLYEVACFPPR